MYDMQSRDGFVDTKYRMKCYGSATVGERGQVVLPVEARKLFEIEPGDKLIVMGIDKGFQSISLMKSESVTKMFEHLFDVEKVMKEGGKTLENLQKEGLKGVKKVLEDSGLEEARKEAEKINEKKSKGKKKLVN